MSCNRRAYSRCVGCVECDRECEFCEGTGVESHLFGESTCGVCGGTGVANHVVADAVRDGRPTADDHCGGHDHAEQPRNSGRAYGPGFGVPPIAAAIVRAGIALGERVGKVERDLRGRWAAFHDALILLSVGLDEEGNGFDDCTY